jgi:hypothetical protein
MRTKELHSYLLDMSQLCYYYTNPHSFFVFTTLYALYDKKCQTTMYGKAYGKALKLFTIL